MPLHGTVLKSTGKWYTVELDDGRIVSCRIRGKLRLSVISTTNPIAVGDRVLVDDVVDEEGKRTIGDYEERINYIVRKSTNLSKKMQILAANVDRAYLIVTLKNPYTHRAFIDRFLVAAESFRIPVTLLFNKIDLYCEKDFVELASVQEMYLSIGYGCRRLSALNLENVPSLRDEIKGKQVLFSGHSGVGKSTLINSLDSGLRIRTGSISVAHLQGQHTTTFAEMHKLSFGGYVIDTPGIRAFGIIDLEKEHLAHYFPEMRALIGECKFHNCLHMNEPKCAVKAAVEEGAIFESRYQSYLQMMREDPDEVYRKANYE
jgi:ribosome biogenesis GTPase